ncbi:MAG: helix-turn-helix transcriptional regulator [Oscillospiraceae bacterium]|nr:helix-turn-helix transcriptional regulator [Oscillospiraceae bacterium]
MFYDKFIQLCELHNEKPTPLLNKLGISSTNLKRWKNGSSVSFDTVNTLSVYFDVQISYFFDDEDEPSVEYVQSGRSLKAIYNSFKAHPDYIASFLNGFDDVLPQYSDYERISDYMHIDMRYLMTSEQYSRLNALPESARLSKHNNIPVRDMILSILGKLPAGDEYKFLQVRISMAIFRNLMVLGITTEQLEETLLPKQKIYELDDIGIPEKKKKNYNFSDLCRISEAFNISFESMFTGKRDSRD